MELHEAQFETSEVMINFAEGPPKGPPFVVLHGGAVRWQQGRALLEALSARWHVYAPDFRGHGMSGRVPGAYCLRDYYEMPGWRRSGDEFGPSGESQLAEGRLYGEINRHREPVLRR